LSLAFPLSALAQASQNANAVFGTVSGVPASSVANQAYNPYSFSLSLSSIQQPSAPFTITAPSSVGGSQHININVTFNPSSAGTYSGTAYVYYSNLLVITVSMSATYAQPMLTGFINPKYVVVGVTYAPPGPSSNVTYSQSTLAGTTITTTSSFQKDTKLTISVSKDISAWTAIAGAGSKITSTESTDWIQSSNSSSTTTLSKQTTVAYETSGTGNPFSPVNHDYDIIWLWVNPLLVYSVNVGTGALQWNGYGYDPHDLPGPDVVGIAVGWLDGHFGSSPSIKKILARGWVTTNEHLVWATGQGPGLTSTDIANVLKADPFVAGYTLPSPLPTNSADGRFTQISYPPNPITYEQLGPTTSYNLVNTDTASQSNGKSTGYTQSFGTDLNLTGGTWFAKFSLDIQTSDTVSWTSTWQSTLTTTETLSKALSITGPPCSTTPCNPIYSGPPEFIVFQDNQYGTFMFYPKN
jgi:hypothetical protein